MLNAFVGLNGSITQCQHGGPANNGIFYRSRIQKGYKALNFLALVLCPQVIVFRNNRLTENVQVSLFKFIAPGKTVFNQYVVFKIDQLVVIVNQEPAIFE